MHAGALKEVVTIQEPVRTVGDGGQPLLSWTSLREKRAAIQGETSKDRVERQRQDNERGWKVTLRFDAAVLDTCRIAWTDLAECEHYMQIRGIIFDHGRRWMYVDAVEVVE